MKKERLERIIEQAYESVMSQHLRSKDMPEVVKVVSEALRLIDAERGKDAVARIDSPVTQQADGLFRAEVTLTKKFAQYTDFYAASTPAIPEGMVLVPPEKPLPDLRLASYHEAIGWNACRDSMLAAAQGGRNA